MGLKEENDQAAVQIPRRIEYFVENKIEIIDMHCGAHHSLVIDSNGRVYGFGANQQGQIGNGTFINVNTPIMIRFFVGLIVDKVCCGYYHWYVKTKCDQHFLFGGYDDRECCYFGQDNEQETRINTPYRFDEIVKQKCKITTIIDVVLGY